MTSALLLYELIFHIPRPQEQEDTSGLYPSHGALIAINSYPTFSLQFFS